MRLARTKWLIVSSLLVSATAARAQEAEAPAAAAPAEASTAPAPAAPATATPVPATSAPAAPTAATAASEDLTTKLGGWTVTLYGQVGVNVMHDSTQSFGIASGNAMLQRRGTFRGNNDQVQLTSRDSRIGLRVNLPDYGSIKS